MSEELGKIKRLKRELKTCRNELCLYCGKYHDRHKGACDGCRWFHLKELEDD